MVMMMDGVHVARGSRPGGHARGGPLRMQVPAAWGLSFPHLGALEVVQASPATTGVHLDMPCHPAALPMAGLMAVLGPAALAMVTRMMGFVWPVSVPTVALLMFALSLGALQLEAGRRQVRLLARHLESFLPRHLAQEIARQHPSGDSLGRPAHGVVRALRVVGLERWSAAVDSLKALGLVHAISSLAEKHARLHGGTLEHLQGDTLLLAWQGPSLAGSEQGLSAPQVGLAKAVQDAVMAARSLHVELGALLVSTETERHPLGLRMALEAGAYLLAVAGLHRHVLAALGWWGGVVCWG